MSRRLIRILLGLFAVSLISLTLLACGHEYGYHHYPYAYNGYGYMSPQQAYSIGYRRGMDNGVADQRDGIRFDYDDNRDYRQGVSGDRRINDAYRDGFARGYRDGYYNGYGRGNGYGSYGGD